MFPNTNDTPAEFTQLAVHFTITLAIAIDFGIPKFPVRFRAAIAAGATVPETAVHKKHQPAPLKQKIRFAENILIATPAGDVVAAQ